MRNLRVLWLAIKGRANIEDGDLGEFTDDKIVWAAEGTLVLIYADGMQAGETKHFFARRAYHNVVSDLVADITGVLVDRWCLFDVLCEIEYVLTLLCLGFHPYYIKL